MFRSDVKTKYGQARSRSEDGSGHNLFMYYLLHERSFVTEVYLSQYKGQKIQNLEELS